MELPAYQAEKIGRLGLIGFLLAFFGTVLYATSSNYDSIAPLLAARAPALLDEVNAYRPVAALNGLMFVSYILGFVMFGIATARAGVLPRWGGVLLAWECRGFSWAGLLNSL